MLVDFPKKISCNGPIYRKHLRSKAIKFFRIQVILRVKDREEKKQKRQKGIIVLIDLDDQRIIRVCP